MGLFLIEYEGFGPETCTNSVGIPSEAFWVVLGLRMVSCRCGKAKNGKNGHFWPIMGLFLIEYEGFGPKTCTKYVGILGEACLLYTSDAADE